MTLALDIALTDSQIREMATIPADAWFTHVEFANASSPSHPHRRLEVTHVVKHALAADWIAESVKGKRVLDLFSANGAFAILAAQSGAKEVAGVEFAPERVRCANFLADALGPQYHLSFRRGDVYRITEYFSEPFDVVLCFGGIYHIADPAYVLTQIRALTAETMILQTSRVIPLPGNWGRFHVRKRDRTAEGLTSARSGQGVWQCTPGCLRALLAHAQFDILDERFPPLLQRKRYPWYLARCHTA